MLNLLMDTTGPKICHQHLSPDYLLDVLRRELARPTSSTLIFMSGLTSAKTVGSTK